MFGMITTVAVFLGKNAVAKNEKVKKMKRLINEYRTHG